MVELLDLPQEMIDRIMEETVGDEPSSMKRNESGVRSSHLAFLLSLRSLHTRLRAALDPLIFGQFSLSLNPILGAEPGMGADMLLSGYYSKFVQSLELVAPPNCDASYNIYIDREQQALATFDQLLQVEYPGLVELSIMAPGVLRQEKRRMRLWKDITIVPMPRLARLVLKDLYFVFYLPRIAQHAPLLQIVELGASSAMHPTVFAQTWEEQGKELITACQAMPVFDTIMISDFNTDSMQICLRHLALRASRITILADIDYWDGSLRQRLAAVESFCNSPELQKLHIELVWSEDNIEAEDVAQYVDLIEIERWKLLQQCRKRCPDPSVSISLTKVRENWADLQEEEGTVNYGEGRIATEILLEVCEL